MVAVEAVATSAHNMYLLQMRSQRDQVNRCQSLTAESCRQLLLMFENEMDGSDISMCFGETGNPSRVG